MCKDVDGTVHPLSGVLALESETFLNIYPTSHVTGEDDVHEGLSRLLELDRGQMIAMHFRWIHGGTHTYIFFFPL